MTDLHKHSLALKQLLSPEIERRVLLTVHQQVTRRIFDLGKTADGGQIGQYSAQYLKKRAKKGFSADPKVILEFTGQMRNDFLLIESSGKFSSGFTNDFNGQKSFWVEDTYNTYIFALTREEEELIQVLFEDEVNKLLI